MAYDSFPIDIMHITLNVVKDMLQLWKGDHPCCVDGNKERYPFVISKESWTRIDEELLALGTGTSESVCGSKPRDSRSYSNWKAHECRRFIAFFAPILLDGHIPKRFMSGIATLSSLIDMCFWPSFSEADVERIHELALSFFRHFEKDYYENDPRRIRLCKSQMHYLLHVADNIRRCGPPVNYSQFFMERFNGYIKQKFNATTCAAESLLEITKRSESWKLVSGRHFVREHFGVEQNRLSPEEAISTVNEIQDAEPLYLKRFSNLSAQYWRQLKLRDLLSEFLMRQNQNFTREDAENCIQNEDFLLHGRVRTGCGVGMYEIGTSSICRSNKTRCDYLIAAEFKGKDEDLRIYYGKVEFFLRYEFQLPSGPVSMDLMLANWVQGLSKNALGQVYVKKRKAPLFEGRTIENVNTISHGVGAVEHYCPRRKEKSIFFIDPQTRIQALLHRGRKSPDGFDRVLADGL